MPLEFEHGVPIDEEVPVWRRALIQDVLGVDDARLSLREAILAGLSGLSNILQPTVSECDRRLPGGRDRQMAREMGYPLPRVKMFQRGFLDIARRRKRLEELRAEGDLPKIAAYERDCFNAIFSGMMGYRPAMFDRKITGAKDNSTLAHIAESGSRGCGGIAVQCAFWIKELGLNAFLCRALQGPTGKEGHMNFLFVNVEGDLHIFDPAMRIGYSRLSPGYYQDQNEIVERLKTGGEQNFRIHASDGKQAYRDGVSTHAVVSDLDHGLLNIFSVWALDQDKMSHEDRLAFIATLETESDKDAIPIDMLLIRMKIWELMGERERALQQARDLVHLNPYGFITLMDVGTMLLRDGHTEDATSALASFLALTVEILDNLLETIDYSREALERPGFKYKMERYLSYNGIVEDCFSHLYVAVHYLNKKFPEGFDTVLEFLESLAEKLYESYERLVRTTDVLLTMSKVKPIANFREQVGGVTIAYLRLKRLFVQPAKPKDS